MTQKIMMIMPVIGMVMLTFLISFLLIKSRYRAVLKDGLSPAYFKLNKGAKLPDYLIKTTQHYDNLFETPILFYVAILLLVALDITDLLYVILSFAYFLSRLLHAYIHLTHNNLRQRRNAFLLSCSVLIVLWTRLSISLLFG